MKKNVGPVDQILRLLIGLVIAILGVVFENWWGLAGVVLVATAIFNFCPIYWVTKLSTAKKEE